MVSNLLTEAHLHPSERLGRRMGAYCPAAPKRPLAARLAAMAVQFLAVVGAVAIVVVWAVVVR